MDHNLTIISLILAVISLILIFITILSDKIINKNFSVNQKTNDHDKKKQRCVYSAREGEMGNKEILLDLIRDLRDKNIKVGALSHVDANLDEYLNACDNAEAVEEILIDFIRELNI